MFYCLQPQNTASQVWTNTDRFNTQPISPLRPKGSYACLYRVSFSPVCFPFLISFRLIVSQHKLSRKGKWHACCALAWRNDAGKANSLAIRRRKSHHWRRKSMTISLHTHISALNTVAVTSVSRWICQAHQKRNFQNQNLSRYLSDSHRQHHLWLWSRL